MKLKKSVVGIIIWFVFTMLLLGVITQTGYTIACNIPRDKWIIEAAMCVGIIAAVTGILIVIRIFSFYIQRQWKLSNKKKIFI